MRMREYRFRNAVDSIEDGFKILNDYVIKLELELKAKDKELQDYREADRVSGFTLPLSEAVISVHTCHNSALRRIHAQEPPLRSVELPKMGKRKPDYNSRIDRLFQSIARLRIGTFLLPFFSR